MKIRLLQTSSGTNGSFAPGEETDWAADKDAARLVAAGIAEKVTPTRKPKVEKAAHTKAVETAVE